MAIWLDTAAGYEPKHILHVDKAEGRKDMLFFTWKVILIDQLNGLRYLLGTELTGKGSSIGSGTGRWVGWGLKLL